MVKIAVSKTVDVGSTPTAPASKQNKGTEVDSVPFLYWLYHDYLGMFNIIDFQTKIVT